MKLIVTQENLSRALSTVGRIASSRTTLPVLNNILLKAENNRLLLAATNLEIAITEHIGAKISTEGSITIPARLLTDYVSNLPKNNVQLELDGTKLHISTDNYKSTINGMPADEFPELPQINEATSVTISSEVFKKSVQQTILTVSHDETRPILTGVYTHTSDGELIFAATDGYRLSQKSLMKTEADFKVIVPAQAYQDAIRVLPESCKEVELKVDTQQVRLLMDNIEITSRLIEGNFPDYRQLIPKETEVNFVAARDELSRITKVASLFARESGGSVTIKTDTHTGSMSIHSLASQLGENTSEITVNPSADGQITLNSRYLIEALGVCDSSEVSFGFSGKLAPCTLKPVGGDDYVHIIMPLKS